jgi:hypothetical protein
VVTARAMLARIRSSDDRKLADKWPIQWPTAMSDSSCEDSDMALTREFGGAEGTRTPDPLSGMSIPRHLGEPRAFTAKHPLTWAGAPNQEQFAPHRVSDGANSGHRRNT